MRFSSANNGTVYMTSFLWFQVLCCPLTGIIRNKLPTLAVFGVMKCRSGNHECDIQDFDKAFFILYSITIGSYFVCAFSECKHLVRKYGLREPLVVVF